jgi:predicted TIM-barrel fold metal-dependent hydrolase
MKYFDINCMVGEWCFKSLHFKTVGGLLSEMDRLGIEKSLVFNSRSWLYAPVPGNDTIVQQVKYSERLMPVMVLTPLIDQEFGGRDVLTGYIRKNNIAAARLFPVDQNYTLNMWNVEKMFSLLDDIRMPVMIESREALGNIDLYFHQIYEIASNFKNTPIILLTVGYRNPRILYEMLDRCPNIYVDTSTFIAFRAIEDAVKYFGSERILFGTRMPFMEGGVSVGRLLYSDISIKDKENIAFRNITNMLAKNKLFSLDTKEGV